MPSPCDHRLARPDEQSALCASCGNRRPLPGPHLPALACTRSTRPVTPTDADEVIRFGAFLTAVAAAGIPGPLRRTPEQRATVARLYAEHYPEELTP